MRLFKKKDEAAEEVEAKEPRGPRGLSSGRLSLFLFLASALVALGTGFLAYGQLAAQADRIQLQKQITVAEQAAARIGGRLLALRETLSTVASDEALVRAMLEADRAGMSEMLQHYREHFVGALSLRLLAPGQSEPDAALKPALGFACLEQARQAEQPSGHGRGVVAQVHSYGSEDQHIDIIHPVRDGERLLGNLQLSLDVALLSRWLEGLVPAGAHMELRQRAGGLSLLLGDSGNAALKGTEPLHSVAIDVSAWELVYRNNYDGLLPEGERMGFASIFAGQLLLLAVIAVAFAILLGRLLRADLHKLTKYFISLRDNKRTHSFALRLSEFQRAMQALDGYVARHPQPPRELNLGAQPAPESGISVEEAPEAENAAEEVSEEKEEDMQEADLPDVMFMDSGSISLEELDDDEKPADPKQGPNT